LTKGEQYTINNLTLIIDRVRHKFFDELVAYLICLISTTLTHELYLRGRAGKYTSGHAIQFSAKQVGKNIVFYPASVLERFFNFVEWPTQLTFNEQHVIIPSHARLRLQTYEKPSFSLLLSMFVNFYEKHKKDTESQFGNIQTWPTEWKFGRVVRNSLAHDGKISFYKSTAPSVSWRGLTYSADNNGQEIIHTDLWPGDVIYLMIDMNNYL
jgi:hypothetical protein